MQKLTYKRDILQKLLFVAWADMGRVWRLCAGVGLSGCGVCSCVGGARLCALWAFNWLVALARGVRDALRSDALRGDARTVGTFGIARRMARTVNAWRGGARIGEGRTERRREGVPTPIERTRGFWACYPFPPKL